MSDPIRQIITDKIRSFHWWNYGLDEVAEAESDDYAIALADEINAALTEYFEEPRSSRG